MAFQKAHMTLRLSKCCQPLYKALLMAQVTHIHKQIDRTNLLMLPLFDFLHILFFANSSSNTSGQRRRLMHIVLAYK